MPENLPFITTNPAMDEYNRANKVAADEQSQDLANQGKVLANKKTAFDLNTAQTEAPMRLRQLNAQTSTAETTAKFAPQEARAKIAEMNSRVAASHMEAFTKSLQLLDAGDVEGAKRAAAMVGDQIPDAIITNAQMRAGVKNITATAQQLFPNRPKDQMTYIHAHITALATQAQQNQPINPQAAPYEQVPGAPQPQETGGAAQGETERIIAHLMQANPKLSYQDAVNAAHATQKSDEMRRETLAQNAAKAENPDMSTLENWRARYGLKPMPGAAAGTPAPGAIPQRPQTVPPGSLYSPSRQMWKSPDGQMFKGDGTPAASAAAAPQVPISQ